MFRPGMYPNVFPSATKRSIYRILSILFRVKWLVDRLCLPLHPRDWPLYLDIHIVSLFRLRKLPNLRQPRSINDQIRWTMLFAQDRRLPSLCDKLAVRSYVEARIGASYLVPLISSGTLSEVLPTLEARTGVLKCTHDSGSSLFISYPDKATIEQIRTRFESLLSRKYGVGKGEWPYGLVQPQTVFEELLPGTRDGVSPPDVKVHCVDGVPRIYDVITDRQTQPRSSLFLSNGQRLAHHFRDDRKPLDDFPIAEAISMLEKPARLLSDGLKYVRVDFYIAEGRPYFGELTFFPESGLYSLRKGVDTTQVLSIPHGSPVPSVYDSRSESLVL